MYALNANNMDLSPFYFGEGISLQRESVRPVIAMECPKPAQLSGGQLGEIHTLEEKMGVILVAYDRVHPYKKLTPQALSKLQSLEKESGSILVAYEA
jgi:hypothetical protein